MRNFVAHDASGAGGLTEIVPGIALGPPLDDADQLFDALAREIEVSAELIRVGGSVVATARRTGWYGDPGATYTYSGFAHVPKPWPPVLAALRTRLSARYALALNSCLVGVYDDGASSVDWHSDDEPELCDRILSVSLGALRTFLLRSATQTVPIAVPLVHGSVLVMSVESQAIWQHSVPAEPVAGRRVNLTFRVIATD
jgi:alkylated DNA repair dioxygenase AlkB